MSWSLLAFIYPAIGIAGVLARTNPATYKKFDVMPESEKASKVRGIAEEVLKAEYVRGSEHFERINEMLKELPDSLSPQSIPSLLRQRLKVIKSETDDYPVFTTGTDAHDGKYYIGIKPDSEVEQALPWIITHEISHILNDDGLNTAVIKTIAALGITTLSALVGLNLWQSLGAAFLTNVIVYTVCSQRAERAADDFAVRHCSRKQLEKAIACLELFKSRRENGTYANNLITWALHPSENSRIAKIRAALDLGGKHKPAV